MLFALNKGEIDEIDLPESAAEYVLNSTPDLKLSCVMHTSPMDYTFCFLEAKAALRDKFNDALKTLEENGTLDSLRAKYLSNPGKNAPEAVKFEVFGDADYST